MNPFAWIKGLFVKAGYPAIGGAPESYPRHAPIHASYGGYMGYGTGGAKWHNGLSATGASPILNHTLLRQNARSAYHETPQARALVERYADTVVDAGLRLEPTPKAEILGITPEAAEDWARRVESSFDSWAQSKKSTRDESMTFYQAQRLVEVFQQRDNDYFVRLTYSPDKRLLNPLQIGFVDPNQIRGSAFTSTYGFQGGQDGIERDEAGREIAYLVWLKQKDGSYKEVTVKAFGPKSQRRFMLHGYQAEYAGQTRGYSRLSHAIQEFENITDFTSAQIKKAINQSNIALYTKPSKENPASAPFEGITTTGAGPASVIGANPTAAPPGSDPVPLDQVVTYFDLPEATMTVPGSVGVFSLQEGEDLNAFPSTAPAESFDSFVNAFTSYLSASMSMPVEVMLMKFNQNYSASRAALILFWRVAQIWRAELAADFLDPVYEMWLSEEIAAGRISAPGWQDPRLRAAWLCNNWVGAPMPNIDPLRTAEADRTYAELGAQTLDRIARNHNGSSGPANRRKLAREYAELPIPPWQTKKAGGGGTDTDNS